VMASRTSVAYNAREHGGLERRFPIPGTRANTVMDLELEQLRPRYGLCRAGFGLIALSIALLCLSNACHLAQLLSQNPFLKQFLDSSFWNWAVGAPITWASLLGSYLLWGRWKEPEWQRRAGLLVLMNFIDLITWFVQNREAFGLGTGELRHAWLMNQVTVILGWSEMLLMSGLATDLILHLGEEQQPEISRASQTLSILGLGLAVIMLLLRTAWDWPLRPLPPNHLTIMMYLGSELLMTMTAFQVTAVSIMAARRCGQYLRELDRYESNHDLLKSRSEGDDPWV
jgi:uncharacterized membrane protein